MSIRLLQNKYKPKKLNEIIGNSEVINYIKKWLDDYCVVKDFLKKNGLLKKSSKGRKKKLVNITDEELEFSKRKGNLLLNGAHGCGKSTIVNLILKDKNYEIINLNLLDPKIKLDVDLISKLAVKNENNTDKKMMLLIDELESVITLNDKNGVFDIIKDNNFNRWMPIIIITNNQHNKQLNETKKYSNEVKIYPPYENELIKWTNNICKLEKINLEYELIHKFIEYCQNDMRKILIQLDELKINYNTDKINNAKFENFTSIMKKKDLDFDLFKSTDIMLTRYYDIDTCIELYETEKVLMPLMVHENYYKFIQKNKYTKVLDNLSIGDILENYIYGEQNWDLLEIHGFISCAIPSYYVNKYSNCKKKVQLIFAADLNRTSVKKMNKKNINKTNENLNKNSKENVRNKSIEEFIYMGEIMNKVNENSKKENSNYISNIIKINKLKNNKTSLTSKKKLNFKIYN